MPRLWNETIEAHRQEVRDAILDTTAGLVAERGLRAVTMSEIAETTGIGRATLYKYFPDVETILAAWHEGRIGHHLEQLMAIRDGAGQPVERLAAVLQAYALIVHDSRHHRDTELAALLHRDERLSRARRQLHDVIRDLVREGAETGELRDDATAEELATYCLHALAAANAVPSKTAVRRVVRLTLDALRPPQVEASPP